MAIPRGLRLGAPVTLGVLLAFGPPVRAQETKDFEPPPPIPQQIENPVPPGFIVIDEHIWSSYLADEPELKCEAAVKEMKAGKLSAAGENVLKVAAFSHMAAARSEPTIKAMLLADADSLRTMGLMLKRNQTVPEPRLRAVFARDLQALALHHADRASRHWLKEDGISAGYDLKAAAMDLRNADTWYGARPNGLREGLAVEATDLADKLIDEEPVDHVNADRIIDQIHERSRELAEELHPDSAATTG